MSIANKDAIWIDSSFTWNMVHPNSKNLPLEIVLTTPSALFHVTFFHVDYLFIFTIENIFRLLNHSNYGLSAVIPAVYSVNEWEATNRVYHIEEKVRPAYWPQACVDNHM